LAVPRIPSVPKSFRVIIFPARIVPSKETSVIGGKCP
jgi:hypothetical protein